ncbi:efflux RND transporter permease subunit [Alginatibacterium sediminis]|uniref:Efflux RND transporter permease subunit n=1 Tax=Alginatibacterium sediminis TaxID=2164068 RepID=A0A420ELD1_9ALTE|nr:efflux RND transporter permease subunit [Alginatibacterium sediminis]RKF21406.1 efflux RND transporter permease subunit [Alginatibacterium sediminis]
MNLAQFAIRQKVFVIFFTVICLISGVISYFQLGKLEDPSFTVKTAAVVTLYPGASALEVERQVTDTVETKLQEMGSLRRLRSISRPGMSMVFVDLQEGLPGSELPQQWDLLRRKINDLKLQLPAGAQISIVQDEFSEVYGMVFAVYGEDVPASSLHDYAQELQRRIKSVTGIKKIELHGVAQQVVNIDIADERLAQYQLSGIQVLNQLASHNMTFDAGQFETQFERIRVDQSSGFHTLDDIKNLSLYSGIGELNSGIVRLGDIADVYFDYQDPMLVENRYNGQPAVVLAVSPQNGVNVVSLGEEIKQLITQYQNELPLGVEIGTIAFQPDEVNKSLKNFMVNLAESILIVVAVLWIFMGPKSAGIVGFSLLLTILMTLCFMLLAGLDLHRVSVGTFILALGMLVDNAIVIVDLYISKLKLRVAPKQAAIESVAEMAWPLFGATVIAIMGTMPVLFSTTDAGEFAISVPILVGASLLLSWFIAMTVTPLLCTHFIQRCPEEKSSKFGNQAARIYNKVLDTVVNRPFVVLLSIVPLMLITALVVPHMKLNFIPASDRPMLFLDYWLPNGGRVDLVSTDLKKVESWLLEQNEVLDVLTAVGTSAPRFSVTVEPEPYDSSYGQILINVRAPEDVDTLIQRGVPWLEENFTYAEPRFRKLKLATSDKYNIEARFSGPDPQVLHQLADQAKAIFEANPNTLAVRDDWRQQSKVLVPLLNQDAARKAGINRADVALALKRATEGVPVAVFAKDNRQIPVILRSTNTSLDNLDSLPVRSISGMHSVPLAQVVDDFEFKAEESVIWRRDRVRTITAQADVWGKTPSEVRKQLMLEIEAIELPYGYSFEWGGEYYDEHRAISDTLAQLPKAMLAMLIILVGMFNSFKQPTIIFLSLPLAFIGIAWMLFLSGIPFGFMALVGVITLTGMIIKNGIVLMDQIELERNQGANLKSAVKSATQNRTLAISMGALTTALGMIPLLSDLLFDQMAATIIGGLFAATLLSLVIMPAMYVLVHRHQSKPNPSVESLKVEHLNYDI